MFLITCSPHKVTVRARVSPSPAVPLCASASGLPRDGLRPEAGHERAGSNCIGTEASRSSGLPGSPGRPDERRRRGAHGPPPPARRKREQERNTSYCRKLPPGVLVTGANPGRCARSLCDVMRTPRKVSEKSPHFTRGSKGLPNTLSSPLKSHVCFGRRRLLAPHLWDWPLFQLDPVHGISASH